jgi:hypothetical protein
LYQIIHPCGLRQCPGSESERGEDLHIPLWIHWQGAYPLLLVGCSLIGLKFPGYMPTQLVDI